MKEKILVLCDDVWHPAEVIERGLAARLDEKYEFDIVRDAKDILTVDMLKRFRLIINCKGNNITEANSTPWFTENMAEVGPRDFEEYIRNGGGFLAVHSGLAYNHERSREYVGISGSVFLGHPPRCNVDMKIVKPEHPIVHGVEDFTVFDEHYDMKMECSDADIFLESRSESGGVKAAGYTRLIGNGRFCALTPGHTLSVWENEQFMKLFTNAMEWCMK